MNQFIVQSFQADRYFPLKICFAILRSLSWCLISVLINYQVISALRDCGKGEPLVIFQFAANDSPELYVVAEREKVCVKVGVFFQ